MPQALLSAVELTQRLRAEFPQAFASECGLCIEEVWHGGCRLRWTYRADALRPGGTIVGATIMALGDYAMYVATLASIGWVPLAVTTNLTVNFLRKPGSRDLVATCTLLKLGRRLAVGEVTVRSDGGNGSGRAHHLDLFDPTAEQLSGGCYNTILLSY